MMLKKIILSLCFLVLSINNVYAIEFYGKSYVVLDSFNNIVLSSHNQDHVQSVASISKIMTCIIAIEEGNLNDVYSIGEEVNEAWGSGVYIQVGDSISLKDLLYGLMLRSGNDAANCIAVNIGGSIENFVDLMNQKANELGLKNTVFSNPTGLDEEDNGNRSSAYDMALLMSYCVQNPIFNEIVNTKSYKREDGKGTWKNKNKLLNEYAYCVGGKTGYTKKAKRTLITRAIKDDVSLIIVTFNAGNDFEFHKEMYEECFEDYKNYILLPRGIYNYQGHSFLIDKDIYGVNDNKKVTFYENNESIEVRVSSNIIYKVEKKKPIEIIISYAYILFKEMLYG